MEVSNKNISVPAKTTTDMIKSAVEKIDPIQFQSSSRSSRIDQKYAESLCNTSKLLLAEDADVRKTDEDDATPTISKNIEKFSVQYRKHVVSEMTEELNKQARQAEQIQIVKANPGAA